MVGKPNKNIPKVELKPIPTVEELFSRILIDCVGPLTRTCSGNKYFLIVICNGTRFPEAIPLGKIKAKTIMKALFKFFLLWLDFLDPHSLIKDQISCPESYNKLCMS